jgi:WD40 repeat protein
MSDEQRDDERMRRILGRSPSVPVPPFDAVRGAPARSPRRSIAVTLATVIVAVAALYAGRELSTFRQQQTTPVPGVAAPSASATAKIVLPQPIPQPITRTSAAAQVAWVGTSELNATGTDRHTVLVGVDPTGKVVGRIDGAVDPFVYRTFRSADGATLLTVGETVITAYAALDGTVVRTYAREPRDGVVDAAFSPDGRWFALIGASAYVQVIDLRTGLTQTTPLGHDPNAQTPGLTVAPGVTIGLIWSTLAFAPDSKHLYTIVNWAGPLRVTAFDVTPSGLVQTATAIDGQGGKTFAGCGGPGLLARVVGGGQTLAFFCHVDGLVEFIDLPTLTATTVRAEMRNPFWLAPIFTPDGQLLYLHQYPSFGDLMQVVDLRSHALLGPVPTPTKTEQPGPFSWLFPQAYAGGTPSTVPVSPDGLKVYSAATGAIAVLRVPDLKPLARLAEGYSLNEVWISGDGKTVYATDGGKGILVMREDGSAQPITVTLPSQVGGFVASEHG